MFLQISHTIETSMHTISAYSMADVPCAVVSLHGRWGLYARWNRNGDKISFDTTDSGFREICEIDISGLNI